MVGFNNGVLGSIFDLVNSIMGVVFVTLPYQSVLFHSAGVSGGAIAFYAMANILTLIMLVSVIEFRPHTGDMGSLLKVFVGPYTAFFYDVAVMISMLGTLCGILAVTTTMIFAMIDASNWTLAFSITALVFLLLVLIPSMAIRISNLRVLNVLAFVSFAVVWVIIMVFGGDQISSGEQMNVPIPAFLDNVMKSFPAFGVLCFAFTSQMNALPIFYDFFEKYHKRPEDNKSKRPLGEELVMIVIPSVAIAGIFYATLAVVGFYLFNDPGCYPTDNIMLCGISNGAMLTAQIFTVIKMVLTFPIFVHPFTNSCINIAKIFFKSNYLRHDHLVLRALIVVPLLAITGILSYYNSDLVIFFGMTGAFADSLISFVFPVVLYVCMENGGRRGGGVDILYVILIAFPILTGVATTVLTLIGLVETYLVSNA